MKFSLREALLGVVILALLAGAVLPYWQVVAHEATLASCQANLRAIHGVMTAYAQNNGGLFPMCDTYYGNSFRTSDATEGYPAVDELKSYGADADMFFCPFHPSYGTDVWPLSTWTTPYVFNGTKVVYIGYTLFLYRAYPYNTVKFTDGRPMPFLLSDPGSLPMMADNLHYRNASFNQGWYHSGGTSGGVLNASANTLFLDGSVALMDWPTLEAQGPGLTVGSSQDKWWFPLRQPNTVAVALDRDWVYQNTPVTTAGRHARSLAFGVTDDPHGNTSYEVTVTATPAEAVEISLEGTPPAWVIRGGSRDAAPTGEVTLTVVARGVEQGGIGAARTTLFVRSLGDTNGDGAVDASDKLEINKSLNGLATLPGIGLHELDLTGDGSNVDAEDKIVINQVLNGLAVP